MSFDGFFTHVMVEELRQQLLKGRIHKIYQPFEQELHMQIRAQGKNSRLVASIHPVYYRLHLSQERPANPQKAPMFNMLLRKHIENSTILDIRQVDNDRIVIFELSGRDELGDRRPYQLIFELMGRHSNIVLVDSQKQVIIDCIKHVPASLNSYRSLQAGANYRFPPSQDQQENILAMSEDDLLTFALKHGETIKAGKANQVIQGLGREGKQQLSYWLQAQAFSPYRALQAFRQQVQDGQPTLYLDRTKPLYYLMALDYLEETGQGFDSLSSLVDRYYQHRVHHDRVQQLSGDILQTIKQVLNRNHKKLEKLNKDRQVAANAENYRIAGELLAAYAHDIHKGESSVSLPNYYQDNEPLEIVLDVRKSAIENSQAYFKRYAKYRDSLKYIDRQKAITQAENAYLEGILLQVEQADLTDIEDIKDELIEQHYLRRKKSSIKKRAQTGSQPRHFKSSDGDDIYVGRNNRQNDEISLKKANKQFWWLHSKDIPGAHVIIANSQPSSTSFQEAAAIAAYFSRAKDSANVPVDAVQVKHLRKPNGAKPGFVIYEGQTTYYATPESELIQRLEQINQL
ncbi:Rqc2 family fibronectin-binding protein [Ignavigranum ruoffiae]|uniref:Rqc2 family fibronectin-binding protein n=1 Tax=Ignavigranum ruoffiae TaxID=89093 RepID=UPI0024AE66E4|nr:NFACT RNA binding domain-containing protein [Ignavigranum ruoffiae]